jgi:hypothetical protein
MKKEVDFPKKFTRTYEDDESISIWKYDLNKQPYGPIEVEYKWKKSSQSIWEDKTKKTIKDLIKKQKIK